MTIITRMEPLRLAELPVFRSEATSDTLNSQMDGSSAQCSRSSPLLLSEVDQFACCRLEVDPASLINLSSEMQMARQFKLNLNSRDSDTLKEIADKLEINESDVVRKGLQLMYLYSKHRDDGVSIIIKEGDTNREVVII